MNPDFLHVLFNGPVYRADAIVVLMGEDAAVRMAVAVKLFRGNASGAGGIVLTGGLDDGQHLIGATRGAGMLLGHGVAPDRVAVESEAANTHEQAVKVIDMAMNSTWERLLLVASAYHLPRAYLTFLKQLQEFDQTDAIHLVPMPAVTVDTPWHGVVPGTEWTRIERLVHESVKVDMYQKKGHVASCQDGIDYLLKWERKREEAKP
jgi:uncharacterized SAM-binding protein YcdF (DUF218 family)